MKLSPFLQKYSYQTVLIILMLIILGNLTGGFAKVDLLWKELTDKSLTTNAGKWEVWLAQHSDLFQPLAEGAMIGICQSPESDYGVLWNKSAGAISVKRTNQMRTDGPGVIFVFDDQVAKDLQWKKNREEVIIFLRHRSQIGKIQAYYLKNVERLKADGFLEFLRQIGLQPGDQ